jgi:hypothetical protein
MKKRIADLPPEEQEKVRAYNRAQKAKSRAAQKAARYVPTADEAADSFAADHPERVKDLDAYVKEFTANVTAELGRGLGQPQIDPSGNVIGFDHDEEFTVERVARCLLGLKHGWVQRVREPDGELVSGRYFADASGIIVESANRHGLTNSRSFNLLYRELLGILDQRYGHQQTEDSAVVRAELTRIAEQLHAVSPLSGNGQS